MNREFLTPKELADLLGLSPITLAVWRSRRVGPPYIKLGDGKSAKVLYPADKLEAWLEKRLREPRRHECA